MLRFALRHAANAWRSPARAASRLVATDILPRSRLGSAPEPITALDQVSAWWLTDTLRSNGFLQSGEVSFVHQYGVQRRRASVTCHLALRYSADAITTAPADLFLKFPPGNHEVRFYRT